MMYIVARDGSGDFTSIQAAVDAMPITSRIPNIIILRMDEYRERVVIDKNNLRIVGEARDRTVITNSACARDRDPDGSERGTFLSFTVIVTGDNVEMENLTIRNDAGDGGTVGQAVALYAAGDRGVYRNCRFIAHQDTLFTGPLMDKVVRDIGGRSGRAQIVPSVGDCPPTFARQYYENCYIQGDVDFIFGPYRCWFEKCTLYMNARGGLYTAANTPESQPYGYVFHRCRLTGECAEGKAFLGRPWRKFSRTVFLECDMDEHVAEQGFSDWDAEKPVTWRYGEWGTTGVRKDLAPRHPRQKRISPEEAKSITLDEVIGGYDLFRPNRRTSSWFLCGDSIMAANGCETYPQRGWGQELEALTENVFVQNLAVNGRSSKSFIAEKRLNFIELCLRPGDKLLIGFGHNDEKDDPKRYTEPRSTFPEYLNMYIDAALRQGAEPILLTPVNRRRFDANGGLMKTHGAYPDAIRTLAKLRGVRLIDLERITEKLFEELGEEGTKRVFCHVPRGHYNYPEGRTDDSHLHENGAVLIAELVAGLMKGEIGTSDMPDPGADRASDAGGSLLRLLAAEDRSCGQDRMTEGKYNA